MRTDPTVNGGAAFYYGQDHEGSVSHLINASGTVIELYRYDAFGAPAIYAPNRTRRSTSSYNNRFLFTGREYAATFGFYEYRARAYHPILGRFMSEDHKLADTGDYNLFRYCHNDPIDFTDPMGLETKLDPWYLHHQQAQALDREYGEKMAAAQWAGSDLLHSVSGATGIGTAGYGAWSALGSLSMAQITKGNSEPSKARQLGMQAVQKAEGDLKKTGQYFGYSIYDVDGKLKWFKSDPGYWDGKRWVEVYRVRGVQDTDFVANGHLHPMPDREHRWLGTSFSDFDKNFFGRLGPVLKRNYERTGYYDEYNKGVTSLVRPDGTTEANY